VVADRPAIPVAAIATKKEQLTEQDPLLGGQANFPAVA